MLFFLQVFRGSVSVYVNGNGLYIVLGKHD